MKTMQTAVVLVGGSGLRMQPFTKDMPKCMIPLNGKPLIHWTLTWLKEWGFDHAVLGVAYRKEVIVNYLRKNPPEIEVSLSEHTVEGETGEGFRLAIQRFVKDEDFLAMNGDEITNLDLERLEEIHMKHKPVATVVVSPMRSPFGILEIEEDNIIGFKEKILLEDKLVSVGVYAFSHTILDYLPLRGSIERVAFPVLAQKRLLKACRLIEGEKWLTVNSVKDLSIAEKELASIRRP